MWRSCKFSASILIIFFPANPHFSHISCITLIWEKSNVANSWFKIYCSTFASVRKASFPKDLSYYSWSSSLETIPVLNKNCICTAWLFLHFHTAQVSTSSQRFKSCPRLHDLNFGSQHFTVPLTWPFSPASNQLFPHHLLSMLVLGMWILFRDKVICNFPCKISSSINAILWTSYI